LLSTRVMEYARRLMYPADRLAATGSLVQVATPMRSAPRGMETENVSRTRTERRHKYMLVSQYIYVNVA